jgi:hypothetical protein
VTALANVLAGSFPLFDEEKPTWFSFAKAIFDGLSGCGPEGGSDQY